MTSPPARAQGFTLLEVIVALTIMALIMVALYAILDTSLRTRDQLEFEAQTARVGPFILDTLENDLSRIWLTNIEEDEVFQGDARTIHGEDADSLAFLTTVDSTLTHRVQEREVASDLCETGYRLRRNPDLPDMLELWRRQDFHVDDEPLAGGNYQRLHDRVVSFRVRFLDELEADAEEIDSWDASLRHRLPAAVIITLDIEVGPRSAERRGARVPGAHTLRYRRVIPLRRDSALAMRVHAIPPAFGTGDDGGIPGGSGDDEGEEQNDGLGGSDLDASGSGTDPPPVQ